MAAPTAGLHLTPRSSTAAGPPAPGVEPVELVVGMGTFRPMSAAKVEDHHMHAERYRVAGATPRPAPVRPGRPGGGRRHHRGAGARVGGLHRASWSGRTELFIHRPWDWRAVDVLLTNFHLPRSSLLVLVDALVGPRWRELYATALAEGYRFLSFGDAMWLERAGEWGGPVTLSFRVAATRGPARTGAVTTARGRSRPRASCRSAPGVRCARCRRPTWTTSVPRSSWATPTT